MPTQIKKIVKGPPPHIILLMYFVGVIPTGHSRAAQPLYKYYYYIEGTYMVHYVVHNASIYDTLLYRYKVEGMKLTSV